MDSFSMGLTTNTMSTESIDVTMMKTRSDSTDSLEDSADDTSGNEHSYKLDEELSFESKRKEGGGSCSNSNATMNNGVHECKWNGCERTFILLDEMVSHVNDDHVRMEDVDYACRWEGCTRRGRGFNARYKMLIHMRTHTNERPHHCHTCGKCFSRLENLKIHTRSHTGEKPYVCSVKGCNKAYSNSSDRFKHTRTHFVDKPFVCNKDGCGKRYTDPSSLRKHKKNYGHKEYEKAVTFASIDIEAASLVDCELGLNGNIRKNNHEQSFDRQLNKRKASITSKVNQIGPLDLTVNHGEDELQMT